MLERQRAFVEQVVLSGKPSVAYKAAYGHPGLDDYEAVNRANRLLKIPEIAEAIDRGREIVAYRSEATGEMAVERMWQIANADPSELIGLTVGCCRHCWGENYERQWTIVEYREALKTAERDAETARAMGIDVSVQMPDIAGGLGYDRTIEPNPECPSCNGVGQHYVRPIDTRDLSPPARLLFNGVKQKADGSIEILMQDRAKHLEMFGRARGVFIDRVRHEGSIAHLHAVTRAVDPHEASHAYQELVKGVPPPLGLPAPEDKA